jgi:acetyl-CoA acyltransferase
MRSAVVVEAVRTPLGRRGGRLAGWHPVELAAETIRELVDRADVDPASINDVVMGCVTQVGAQSTNIARSAVLAAGWPETVPGTTIDRQCGSSQQALHFAAQGVIAGAYDVAVASGVEMMSVVPMFSNEQGSLDDLYGPLIVKRYSDRRSFGIPGIVRQGVSAELVADRWKLSRHDLDSFAFFSHEKAGKARAAGRFANEIHPVAEKLRDRDTHVSTSTGSVVLDDGGIRQTSMELLAELPSAFLPSGRVTAGNSSQISDGAAALLVVEEATASKLGLRPLARVASFALAATDPVEMLMAIIPATEQALKRAGLTVGDIDIFEVNEAFAAPVLAWQQELEVDPAKINPSGGAIALGHPLGATGARLATTLVHGLTSSGGRYGLQTICEGGGMANATVFECLA